MSQSEKNNKKHFEEAWQEALEGAQMPPPKHLWDNIEAEIAPPNRGKRFWLYTRPIAAALIFLLLSIGLLSIIDTYKQNQVEKQSLLTDIPAFIPPFNPNISSNIPPVFSDKSDSSLFQLNYPNGISYYVAKPKEPIEKDAVTVESFTLADENTISLDALDKFEAVYGWEYSSLTKKQSFRQKIIPSFKRLKQKFKPEFYVSFNANYEYFNPQFTSISPREPLRYRVFPNVYEEIYRETNTQVALSDRNFNLLIGNNAAEQGDVLSLSYSYGVNFGMLFAKRFILESGLSYINYNITTRSNLTIGDIDSNERYPLAINSTFNRIDVASSITTVPEYKLNNIFNFVSVPFRVGYSFGGNQTNFILKTGITTDFFVANKLTADGINLQDFEILASSSFSPYKRVLVNGVVGGELNFKISPKFSFAVESHYRYALSSFTQASSQSIVSRPSSISTGISLKYFFRRNNIVIPIRYVKPRNSRKWSYVNAM